MSDVLYQIEAGESCSVIKDYHLEKRVVDVELTEKKNSPFLTVLYGNKETPETAGNNIFLFNKDFEVVFELRNSEHYFTSTFKWASRSPEVVNVALTVMLSRQVHLITINIAQVRTR